MLIVHLFVSCAHVKLCHCFSSSWCQGLAAASACGSSWTFLFTFLQTKNQNLLSAHLITFEAEFQKALYLRVTLGLNVFYIFL